MDSRRRSLVKSLTWRILAFLITISVSFALLGVWSTSLAIAIASNFLKTIFFYIHERVWERFKWGKT